MDANSQTESARKHFLFSENEIQSLQSASRQLSKLCEIIAHDKDAAQKFLEAAIKADRPALSSYTNGENLPSHVGPIPRMTNDAGVREATCQIRYNVGRFRFSLGLEEQ